MVNEVGMPLIPSLVPPRAGVVGRGQRAAAVTAVQRRVPVPSLSELRERSSVYGLSAVDNRGRVAAYHLLETLGWTPGTAVAVGQQGGLVVVTVQDGSHVRVTPRGHLRVPAPVRQWCGLAPGIRVLLVADVAEQRLVVHPLASLDLMVNRRHADVFGGDA